VTTHLDGNVLAGTLGEVVLRVTQPTGRTWLDLRGVRYLELQTPSE
jgi:hypothetical protein